MITILGIDPGTAKMGYSVVEAGSRGSARVIETNVLSTPAEQEMHHRLKSLYTSLKALLIRHSPKVMVIERLFFNTNVTTAISVGQARGVVMLAAADKKIPIYEYTALQAKVLLTGYGRSTKKEMQEAVKAALGLDELVKSDDANDAIAIAMCFVKKDLANYLKLK